MPIDVRAVIVNDELIIRIRDHCPNFDLSKRISLVHGNNDPTQYLGIKIIAATAQKVDYVNLMETNTLFWLYQQETEVLSDSHEAPDAWDKGNFELSYFQLIRKKGMPLPK